MGGRKLQNERLILPPAPPEALTLHWSSGRKVLMVRAAHEHVRTAVVAYIGIRRQRQKASSLAMRRLQASCLAEQDNAVVRALALYAASNMGEDKRVVPRALGKRRGSTIAGYLSHDDISYVPSQSRRRPPRCRPRRGDPCRRRIRSQGRARQRGGLAGEKWVSGSTACRVRLSSCSKPTAGRAREP